MNDDFDFDLVSHLFVAFLASEEEEEEKRGEEDGQQ